MTLISRAIPASLSACPATVRRLVSAEPELGAGLNALYGGESALQTCYSAYYLKPAASGYQAVTRSAHAPYRFESQLYAHGMIGERVQWIGVHFASSNSNALSRLTRLCLSDLSQAMIAPALDENKTWLDFPDLVSALRRPRASLEFFFSIESVKDLDKELLRALGRQFVREFDQNTYLEGATFGLDIDLISSAEVLVGIREGLGHLERYRTSSVHLPEHLIAGASYRDIQEVFLGTGLGLILNAIEGLKPRRTPLSFLSRSLSSAAQPLAGVQCAFMQTDLAGSHFAKKLNELGIEWVDLKSVGAKLSPHILLLDEASLQDMKEYPTRWAPLLRSAKVVVEWSATLSEQAEQFILTQNPSLTILPLPLVRLPLIFLQGVSSAWQNLQAQHKQRLGDSQELVKSRHILTPAALLTAQQLQHLQEWPRLFADFLIKKHQAALKLSQDDKIPYHQAIYRAALAGLNMWLS